MQIASDWSVLPLDRCFVGIEGARIVESRRWRYGAMYQPNTASASIAGDKTVTPRMVFP